MNDNELKVILGMPNDRAIEVVDERSFDEEVFRALVDKLGYRLFHLNGMEIKSKGDLLTTLAQTMEFPEYFGNNWDALEECLQDLEWMPAKGYVLLFSHPENYAKNSPSDFNTFLDIVLSVSRHWSSQQIRFLSILVTANDNNFLNMLRHFK